MRIVFSLLFFLALTTGVQAQCDSGEKIIKLGTYSDSDHQPRDKGATLFRDAVNSELQGKACVEIVLDEARFAGTVGITALQNGEVQMMIPSFKTLGRFSSPYRIFDLPFAFRDLSVVERFQVASGGNFVSALAINGLHPLAFWHGNFKQMSGKKPIYLPVDVAGLKFRADGGANFFSQISALRATSTPIAENDLTIAVKSGKIYVQISKWAQLYEDGTAKIFAGATETNHGFVGYQLLASRVWWGDLDKPLQKSLVEIIGRISRQLNFDTARCMKNAKHNLMRSGVVVRALTDTQRRAWIEKLQDVWEAYNSQTNAPFMAALTKANAGL